MRNIIKISNLNVYYENVCALHNINLEIKDKEFLAILGPNGGGKSTLLKVILGFKVPKHGEIKICDMTPSDARRLIGYVPQFTKFNKKFPISVEEVVLMGKLGGKMKIFHRFTNEDREKAHKIMKKLSIYELKNRQIGQLSGGQMQRVLIARALLVEPKILLLDEPTASLDARTKIQIYELLKELNKDMTIIIVTHDIKMVSSYVSTIACINQKLYYHGDLKVDSNIFEQIYGLQVNLGDEGHYKEGLI